MSDTLTQSVQELKDKANADESYKNRCFHCKEKVVFVEADHAVLPAHIYSSSGRKEYRISKCCEFCFDELFGEDEENATD